MESACINPPKHDAACSGTTIEIKIKTMDSQTYSLQVDKQMPVPALKEQIASVTGVATEHQRLICRGRVLKNDQLLSAYHIVQKKLKRRGRSSKNVLDVEDGHTLHLVVREPASSSTGNVASESAYPGSNNDGGQYYQNAPGIVVEAFNMPGQVDRHHPDIGRILSAVLGSIGIPSPGPGEWTSTTDAGGERFYSGPGEILMDAEQLDLRGRNDVSRQHNSSAVPPAVSVQPVQPPVIPDAVATLSQYLSHMRSEFAANVRTGEADTGPAISPGTNGTESRSASEPGSVPEGLPTPASLAELLLSTREMLDSGTGVSLMQLADQLQNQSSEIDPAARSRIQSSAWRTGVLLQNLGAYFFELGRTTMTLRLGRSPSEAVVNAGPAVFISPSGPNPLMVQPVPFQPGASFGTTTFGNLQPNSVAVNGPGTGLPPRRIDIQIRRGSSLPNQADGSQQASGQRNPSNNVNGEPPVSQSAAATSNRGATVHVLPLRTMIAVPDLNGPPPESSGPLNNPVLGRNLRFGVGQALSDQFNTTLQQATTEPVTYRHVPDHTRNEGGIPAPTSGSGDQLPSRSIGINLVSSGRNNNERSDGAVPESVVQFFRNLFPSAELHIENNMSGGNAAGSAEDHGRTSSTVTQEAQPPAPPEALFFSRMLQEIMPVISQHVNPLEGASTSSAQGENPESGASREQNDPDVPSSAKRQKKE